MEKLPTLTEREKSQLKIYKPSFTKQELNFETANFSPLGRLVKAPSIVSLPTNVSRKGMDLDWRNKGRILYGNETDINEYPWQVK